MQGCQIIIRQIFKNNFNMFKHKRWEFSRQILYKKKPKLCLSGKHSDKDRKKNEAANKRDSLPRKQK